MLSDKETKNNKLYHERQKLALCGIHAVNNLLQNPRYTKNDFDHVCLALSPESAWRNPHRSMWGVGNYDVNVVIVLLQQDGLSVKWHDKRKAIGVDSVDNLLGVLWNVESDSILDRLVLRGRHWIALLYIDAQWVNLDSVLPEPEIVGSNEDFIHLLNSKEDAHVLFIQKEAKG